MEALKLTTTARIGIGHAGSRYPTPAQLKFKEDLACARDTVHREVPQSLVKSLGLLFLKTQARDRREYLMNTRCGRLLDDESQKTLQAKAVKNPDVQLVTSDGLSCEAFERNVPEMLPLLTSRFAREKITQGTPVFVRRARVAVVDALGEIIRPKAALILIGERPGLGISDSLSGYFEYQPCPERVESDRNVMCNIHRRGIPPSEAALMLAEALLEVLRIRKSGMTVRFNFS